VAIHVINYRDGPAGIIAPLKVVTFVFLSSWNKWSRTRYGSTGEAFANRLEPFRFLTNIFSFKELIFTLEVS
jgi:hypothetical protein